MFGFYRFEDVCHYQGLRFVKFDAVRFGHEKFRRDSTSLWMESCNQDRDAQGRNRFSVWEEMDGTRWVAAISRLVMESVRTPPTPSKHSHGQSHDPKEVDWEALFNAMSEEDQELERQGLNHDDSFRSSAVSAKKVDWAALSEAASEADRELDDSPTSPAFAEGESKEGNIDFDNPDYFSDPGEEITNLVNMLIAD
jgi:hypothetical protein